MTKTEHGSADEMRCFRCNAPAESFMDFWPRPSKGGRFHVCDACSDYLFEMPSEEREREMDAKDAPWQIGSRR